MASRGGAFVVLVVLCSLPVLPLQACATKKPLVPAMFVFGDSLVDVGNNNHLPNVNNSCKANYPPYGVDYPGHLPTGRFSNGYNLADHLAQQLGFAESPPPFFSPTNAKARRFSRLTSTGGINFASGGSGLLNTTGGSKVCGGQVVSMAEQVGNFKSLVRTWESKKRKQAAAAADLISNSLVFISVGSNDLFEYSDFFADPNHDPNVTRNDPAFLQELVTLYAAYVKDLYAAGATKFSIVSPSLVGCCPSQRKIANESNDMDGSGCFSTANNLSWQLYPMIHSMLRNLSQNELLGMKYSLGDAIGMAQYILGHLRTPPNIFTTPPYRPCCGSGDFGGTGCNDSVPLCDDRSSFFFWDRFHPTEAVSAITAQQLFGGNGTFVHPVNVQQLVASSASRP
ncbi:GDSL esterase/lipase At4g16230-like [Miscanthus floridulus]|uniref:GDSL esterase/lipase At4g16230-like n=1 Tax=Miscanthus floridulus TaxID=154761 RepID=UPI00345758F9